MRFRGYLIRFVPKIPPSLLFSESEKLGLYRGLKVYHCLVGDDSWRERLSLSIHDLTSVFPDVVERNVAQCALFSPHEIDLFSIEKKPGEGRVGKPSFLTRAGKPFFGYQPPSCLGCWAVGGHVVNGLPPPADFAGGIGLFTPESGPDR